MATYYVRRRLSINQATGLKGVLLYVYRLGAVSGKRMVTVKGRLVCDFSSTIPYLPSQPKHSDSSTLTCMLRV